MLAIGSTSPGLLSAIIDKFSQVFPDYRSRVVAHEAGHFLAAYLLGIPIAGYSVEIGKEHTDLVDAKLQARLFERTLGDEELDQLAVVAMAGLAAEGMKHEDVQGQSADLMLLQR